MKNKKITHNLGLKILSLLFSIGLWLSVMNISDPSKSATYSGIPVEIENSELITNEGKVFSVEDNVETVTVKVTGKRSLIDSLSKDDIRAIADMKDLSFMNTVTIRVVSSKYSNQITLQSLTENLKLDIEDIKRVQLAIETVTTGEPHTGYIVGNVTPEQNIVRISGPQSVIDEIDRIEASVDVNNATSDIKTSAELKLYDAEGDEIKSNALTQNISNVLVSVSILDTKQIPIHYSTSGIPADGYMTTGEIVSVPATVTVAGKKSVIEAMNGVIVEDAALNITGQTSDMTTIIDIGKYLPAGVTFADSTFNGAASVTVKIEAAETRDFDVPLSNILLTNEPEEFVASIEGADDEDAVYSIALTGLASKIITMSDENIRGVVNLEELKETLELEEWAEGTYTAPITFSLDDDVKTNNVYTVRVHIDKKTEENE